MTWLRIEDGFADHPKVDRLTDSAFRLYVNGLCYCAKHMTDGLLGDATVKRLGPAKARSELVAAGLWVVVDAGVEVHDFLTYNPSRAQVEEERERKAAAGRKGADSRWHGGRHDASHGGPNGSGRPDGIGSSMPPTRPGPAPIGPESVVKLSSSTDPPTASPQAAVGSPDDEQEQHQPDVAANLAGIAALRAAVKPLVHPNPARRR